MPVQEPGLETGLQVQDPSIVQVAANAWTDVFSTAATAFTALITGAQSLAERPFESVDNAVNAVSTNVENVVDESTGVANAAVENAATAAVLFSGAQFFTLAALGGAAYIAVFGAPTAIAKALK